jgi:hypothetical protein
MPALLLDSWPEFIHTVWPNHLQSIEERPRLNAKHARMLKELIHESLVVHNADHQAGHLMLYCPNLYCRTVYNTWNDTSVFQEVHESAEVYQALLPARVPARLIKQYPWGFDFKNKLPNGYVFLKGKKQFKKARTIVAFASSAPEKLLKATAIALAEVLNVVWPEVLGLDKTLKYGRGFTNSWTTARLKRT